MPGFAIDDHPQKQKIIDGILAGLSTRAISASLVPPVSFNAIQRYKVSVIKPMLQRAEESNRILLGNKILKTPPADLSNASEAVQAVQKAILDAPALHIRENRIKIQQELTNRLLTVVKERAADMAVCESCRRREDEHPWEEMRDSFDKDGKPIEVRHGCDVYRRVPGGETGLIVRKLKSTGIEYAVDTAVLAEIREQEKHVAIELGQWQEGTGGQVSIQILCPTAPGGDQMPRVVLGDAPLAIEAGDDAIDAEFEDIGVIQQK